MRRPCQRAVPPRGRRQESATSKKYRAFSISSARPRPLSGSGPPHGEAAPCSGSRRRGRASFFPASAFLGTRHPTMRGPRLRCPAPGCLPAPATPCRDSRPGRPPFPRHAAAEPGTGDGKRHRLSRCCNRCNRTAARDAQATEKEENRPPKPESRARHAQAERELPHRRAGPENRERHAQVAVLPEGYNGEWGAAGR